MQRRDLMKSAAIGAAAAALPRFAIAQPAGNRVVKFVPQANLTSLDPIWTTANITRNHGYMVFDTLYGMTADFQATPQMAEGHVIEDDGKSVTITLRPNLRFHDGEPVRAADCAASVKRWMKRSPIGQKLETFTDAVEAVDDRRLRFRLKRAFPMLIQALAQVSNSPPFIMPERLANTDAFTQIREAIGSGPFRFKADEFNSGSRVVYEKNANYVPVASGTPSLTAGPKTPHFDRVEWEIIVDAATAAAALQTGEIDWYEQPNPEIQTMLRRNRQLVIEEIDPLPLTGILRFNHLHPPFNDKKLRQALLPAISQADFMSAVVGPDPSVYGVDVGLFTPGTPLANDAGLAPLRGPRSLDRAKALMREAGYTNQPMRLIAPTDILAPSAMSQVGADLVQRLGFNTDAVFADWGTVVQRRTSREPVERGGWSMLFTSFSSFDFVDPAAHFPLRGNGTQAWPGWPTIPRLEELRDAWFLAPDLAAQQVIAREMQTIAMDELPYIPVGAYKSLTAIRRDLTGRVKGMALFWNLRRA
ncbi:ABC transporter substrate-binding protein [Roseomonas hellenica]|uniref:ABC transporter substrate-binding protein n=1 Tax=Plastoroseomonas hellenica TaxID=2687306 RepID=A0ABS5F2W0_9PROT|nr:ABC transporter substrate-binding protein [Plastoroseomonas hellenica]MBR0666887.1 ABC transporter substrate-binding protein [Plastoroseomonas hellenica]